MRFVLLGFSDEAAFRALPEAELEANLKAHAAFAARLRAENKLVHGEGLGSSTDSVTVHASTGQVTDGPYAEVKEQLGGLYIIEVPDRDEAIEWAKRVPPSPGLRVEVRPA